MSLLFFCYPKRSISRLKTPFLQKDRRVSSANEYTTYRGDLYSLEEYSHEKSSPQDKEIDSHDVEVIARIAFVVAFAVFNFFYWIGLVYFV